jgi:hypothetical protein
MYFEFGDAQRQDNYQTQFIIGMGAAMLPESLMWAGRPPDFDGSTVTALDEVDAALHGHTALESCLAPCPRTSRNRVTTGGAYRIRTCDFHRVSNGFTKEIVSIFAAWSNRNAHDAHISSE